jgi:3-oxoadipate enol-lactonase/4-carboxymuconolactone decarboxylase
MSGPEERVVPTGLADLGTKIHRAHADAPTLVLTHGIFMDSTLWHDVVPGFRDCNVLLIDGPAHGGSSAPVRAWSLPQHVESILAVLDSYGLDRVVLAGHSWGGMVSARLALRRPDRIAALALVNTPLTRTGARARIGFHLQRALLSTTGSSAFFARRAAAALYGRATLAARPDLVVSMVDRLTSRQGRDLARTLDAVILQPPSLVGDLGRLRMPVSILAGADDYVLPPRLREDLRAAAPGAAVTIGRGGHISPQEDPAAVVGAIRGLLHRAGLDR